MQQIFRVARAIVASLKLSLDVFTKEKHYSTKQYFIKFLIFFKSHNIKDTKT